MIIWVRLQIQMAEGGGGEDLDKYGDRKRREMLGRIEGRKRRGVAGLQPVDMEVEVGEVHHVSVPMEEEDLQPSASASPTTLGATGDLPTSDITEIADIVK